MNDADLLVITDAFLRDPSVTMLSMLQNTRSKLKTCVPVPRSAKMDMVVLSVDAVTPARLDREDQVNSMAITDVGLRLRSAAEEGALLDIGRSSTLEQAAEYRRLRMS